MLNESLEWDYPNTGDVRRFAVHDQEKADAGWQTFERGLAKPRIELTYHGWHALFEFLDASSLPVTEIDDVTRNQDISMMPLQAMRICHLWLKWRAQDAERDEDLVAAWDDMQTASRLAEQFVAHDKKDDYLLILRVLETDLVDMIDFAEEYPHVVSAEHAADVRTRAEQVNSRRVADEEAARRLNARSDRPPWQWPRLLATDHITAYVVDSLPEVFILMLGLAILFRCVGREHSKQAQSKRANRSVGWLGITLAWLLACAATVVFLGAMPTELISARFQHLFFTGLVLAIPALTGLVFVLWLLKRSRRRFTLATLFVVITLICLPLPLIAEVLKFRDFFSPFELAMPAQSFLGMERLELHSILKPPTDVHCLASLQWILFGGPYVTIGLWGFLVASLFLLRRKKKTRHAEGDTRAGPRPEDVHGRAALKLKLRNLTRSWSNGLWLPAMLVLSAYLWATPKIISEQERQFQQHVAGVRDVSAHWQLVDEIEQELRQEDDFLEEVQAAAGDNIDQLLQQMRDRRASQ